MNATKTTTRYAGEGAVNQGGPLPIRQCNTCGRDIVFAKSNRTGKFYAVTVHTGYKGQPFYVKSNAHFSDCEYLRTESALATAQETLKAALLNASRAHREALASWRAASDNCWLEAAKNYMKEAKRIEALMNDDAAVIAEFGEASA